MPQTLSKVLTRRLLRSHRFRVQLRDLHTLSGMEAVFLDPLGNERIRIPREHTLPLHILAAKTPDLATEWRILRQRALGPVSKTPEQAPAWHEIPHTLGIEGETVGYLLLTACRPVSQHVAPLRELWLRLAGKGVDLPWSRLRDAWEALPVLSRDRREAWQRHLLLQGQEALKLFEDEVGALPRSDALPPLILNVCEQVNARYMDPLTLRALASEQGVSPEHLSRLFHQSTGIRFREYLAETRVNAAKQALRESSDLISEIAGRSGFSTLSRFNRAFRELTGTTPREFRKRGIAP